MSDDPYVEVWIRWEAHQRARQAEIEKRRDEAAARRAALPRCPSIYNMVQCQQPTGHRGAHRYISDDPVLRAETVVRWPQTPAEETARKAEQEARYQAKLAAVRDARDALRRAQPPTRWYACVRRLRGRWIRRKGTLGFCRALMYQVSPENRGWIEAWDQPAAPWTWEARNGPYFKLPRVYRRDTSRFVPLPGNPTAAVATQTHGYPVPWSWTAIHRWAPSEIPLLGGEDD